MITTSENNKTTTPGTPVNGWGVDADPENDPTYPMKKFTGDDYLRLSYQRPVAQPVNNEVLYSNERPGMTAVFGTSSPPSGLSGVVRRFAFRYSEGSWTHWLSLLLADRINAVEGVVEDLAHGHVPNMIKERGWSAEWRYNRKGVLRKTAVGVAVASAIAVYVIYKRKKR